MRSHPCNFCALTAGEHTLLQAVTGQVLSLVLVSGDCNCNPALCQEAKSPACLQHCPVPKTLDSF